MTIIQLEGLITKPGKLEIDLPADVPLGNVKVTLEFEEAPKQPKRSLLGVLAHLGQAPSAEEIDEARREIWANFPREDF